MRRPSCLLLVTLLCTGGPGRAAEPGESLAALRAQFAEVGRLAVERAAGRYPPPNRNRFQRTADEEIKVQLRRADRRLLAEAIDQSVREGSREEQMGAWGMYSELIYLKKMEKREDYHPLLRDRLSHDDLTTVVLTRIMVGVITQYPSRATLQVLIDLADRIPTLQDRYQVLAITADMLGGDLPVYRDTTEAQLQKIVADFLAYLHENRDRIRFDRDGRAHLPGGPPGGRPKSLTSADRQRVRDDPVCVLRLLHESFLDSAGTPSIEELVNRCGEALFGAEGVARMRELAAVPEGDSPSVDLQMRLAAAYGTHPVNDAAILAAAYVAAYRREPELLKMAADVMEMVGGVDRAEKVTRGEPREVRQAAEALADRIAGR